MLSKEEREAKKTQSEIHINENLTLIFIVFTIFTFIVTINDQILKSDLFLATQLVLSIPLFASSLFARATLATHPENKPLGKYGFICFTIAYSFLINSVGILLSTFVSLGIGIIFFAVNALMTLAYSIIIVKANPSKLKNRLYKDSYFIITIIVLGLLHVLNVY